jgi:hypothetical protein
MKHHETHRFGGVLGVCSISHEIWGFPKWGMPKIMAFHTKIVQVWLIWGTPILLNKNRYSTSKKCKSFGIGDGSDWAFHHFIMLLRYGGLVAASCWQQSCMHLRMNDWQILHGRMPLVASAYTTQCVVLATWPTACFDLELQQVLCHHVSDRSGQHDVWYIQLCYFWLSDSVMLEAPSRNLLRTTDVELAE